MNEQFPGRDFNPLDKPPMTACDPTPGIFTLGLVNFPQAKIDELEVFFDRAPSASWAVSGNLGFNDARTSETAVLFEGSGTDILVEEGTQLPLVADFEASVNFDYNFANTLFDADASLGFGFEYVGDSVNSLDGIQSIAAVNDTRVQPSCSLANVHYSLDGPDWTVTLFIDNLFDEYAQQFFNDRWVQTRVSVNQPRTFGINYRKHF